MSKYVKDLLTNEIRRRLTGVENALMVSISGLSANDNYEMRKSLRAKKISLMVVKNSLARRATEGTVISKGFEGLEGHTAVLFGDVDIVSVAKEIIRITKEKKYSSVKPKGGVIDGQKIAAEEIEVVSKWPTREEQLSILVGQILSPGAMLASQLNSVGGALASQIKQKGEEQDAPADSSAAPTEG